MQVKQVLAVAVWAILLQQLTFILRMDVPIIIIWASPLSFLGVLCVILNIYLIFSMKFL